MTSATDKSIDRLVVNAKTRRRNSSVGKIDLGDTVPGFAAMPESAASKNEAKKRMKALTGDSKKDSDLLWKVWFSYREMNYRHSWLTPFFILVCVYSAYFLSGNRTESNPLHMFVAISYQVDGTDSYAKGIKDLCFVFFYMIFFTFLREFLMDVVIRPFTVYLNVTSEHRQKRMLEQMYAIFYCGVSGPFGLYIMYHSDLWLFKTKPMYRTYPDITNPFLFKIFYLGQAAFWAQQACVLVLQLEKPRKDYKELVFHHIVTLLLIWSSYVFHFTKMGLAIYITMDVSDFFLSLSKTLNYLNSVFTPFVFGLFVFFWIYLRHVVNIRILWSVLTEFRHEGNYVLNFATQQYKCWISLPIVFVLIAALQLVNLYWLFLILRILYRLIWQGIQKDERSDSDSDESAENEESKEKCE
ncbi:CPA_1a_G0023440.mRNA.1.CDS.1 [Saccharomyces cerevisiae]|nr:CPA_1a_G0023440.mRNA.1.CDS.1 [Saccharomyces cerevisiae]CAI4509822.1 BBM_1a_G0023140.mRNA.1.CDS.1 [Saccharomyces cerevisiae]CAI7143828.1 BBM_1a_G0023140.mRNA.1.CDS.1 [Saccharomyces cerevisiae]CAI7327271.1 CPA_1a_G0023440.mRNA.1.CDS.1 [Saccharomyces cerevisiae]